MQGFLRLLVSLARFLPCPLCGHIHEPKIHALVARKYRDTTTISNREVLIPVLRCPTAQAQGLAYTKRILPPFLHPFCVIRLDCAMDCLRRYPDGLVGCAEACSLLGAADARTARRHLRMTLEGIKGAALQVSTVLSELPSYASLGGNPIGQTALESLEEAGRQVQRAAGRLKGGGRGPLPVQLYVYAVGVERRATRRLAISLTLVLHAWLLHDTG